MAESLPPGGEVPCLDVHCKHDGVRPTARGGRAQTGVPGRCTVSLDDAEHESNTSAFTLTTIAKSDPHSISGICIALYLFESPLSGSSFISFLLLYSTQTLS